MQVEFKFNFCDYIKITLHGVNYNGRINRCIYDGGKNIYLVVYCDDKGDFQSREFYEDELVGVVT